MTTTDLQDHKADLMRFFRCDDVKLGEDGDVLGFFWSTGSWQVLRGTLSEAVEAAAD